MYAQLGLFLSILNLLECNRKPNVAISNTEFLEKPFDGLGLAYSICFKWIELNAFSFVKSIFSTTVVKNASVGYSLEFDET